MLLSRGKGDDKAHMLRLQQQYMQDDQLSAIYMNNVSISRDEMSRIESEHKIRESMTRVPTMDKDKNLCRLTCCGSGNQESACAIF